MFSELISIIAIIGIAFILLEQRKIKRSLSDIKSEINKDSAPEQPIFRKEFETNEWWQLDTPKLTLLTKLLKDDSIEPEGENIENNKKIIKEALDGFVIKYEEIKEPVVGPSATLYPFRPSPGVRIQDVTDLKKDIALALSMENVKIIAPIPGTNQIGFEIPNKVEAKVGLKRELESEEYKKTEGDMILPMGKDSKYKSWYASLVNMPHLLIGGATNSGKSNLIHSIF